MVKHPHQGVVVGVGLKHPFSQSQLIVAHDELASPSPAPSTPIFYHPLYIVWLESEGVFEAHLPHSVSSVSPVALFVGGPERHIFPMTGLSATDWMGGRGRGRWVEKHLIDIWLPFAKPANVMENDAGEPVMDS